MLSAFSTGVLHLDDFKFVFGHVIGRAGKQDAQKWNNSHSPWNRNPVVRDDEPDELGSHGSLRKPLPPFCRLSRFSSLRAWESVNDSLSQTNDHGPRCRVHFETPWLCAATGFEHFHSARCKTFRGVPDYINLINIGHGHKKPRTGRG